MIQSNSSQTNKLNLQEAIIYKFVVDFSKRKGFLPKLEEISASKNKALSSLLFILKDLSKKGYIKFDLENFSISSLPLEKDIVIQERSDANVSSIILTEKQKAVYDYTKSFIAFNGYSPSIRDYQKYFGYTSPATVHKFLNYLEYKGYILRGKRNSLITEIFDFNEIKRSDSKNTINISNTSDTVLSSKQRELYDFIVGFVRESRRSPSLEELSLVFGIGKSCLSNRIVELRDRGYILKGSRNNLVAGLPKEEIVF